MAGDHEQVMVLPLMDLNPAGGQAEGQTGTSRAAVTPLDQVVAVQEPLDRK